MPAFGGNILDTESIEQVATYVRSLSDDTVTSGSRVDELLKAQQGRGIFAQQCAACHGAEALGNTLLGAPNLTDDYWIYGGNQSFIVETLRKGRGGHMPAWQDRLSDVQLRILSLYVANLSKPAVEKSADSTE